MKMADIDINPFSNHDKMDTQPDETGKTIPLNPGGVVVGGGATWKPEHIQETLFREKSQRTRLKEVQVEGLCQKLTEITHQTTEASHFNDFKLKDRELYYKDKNISLMTEGGKLRSFLVIARILSDEGLSQVRFQHT